MAAKYIPEGEGLAGKGLAGEGLAGEGWNIKPDVIAPTCTEFIEAPCSCTHALSCHSLHSRSQVLGCAEPGTAWICVLW